MDAWYLQQKRRETEMKQRRQEAENMLRGYRSSYIPNAAGREMKGPARTKSLSEKATSLTKVGEAMADPDSDIYEKSTLGIQRLIIDEYVAIDGDVKLPSGADAGEEKILVSPEAAIDPAVRQKPVPTEWRDFVEPGKYNVLLGSNLQNRLTHDSHTSIQNQMRCFHLKVVGITYSPHTLAPDPTVLSLSER